MIEFFILPQTPAAAPGIEECLTALHTTEKLRLKNNPPGRCTKFKRRNGVVYNYKNQILIRLCLQKVPWHEACDVSFQAPPCWRGCEIAGGPSAKREQAMDFSRISRRHLLQGSAALAFGITIGARQALAADTTIGFIYVGSRDDYGYNQAHAQGAAALKKLPGLKVVEEEKVPETDAVEKTIESMINLDGASLLFPTSF